MNKKIRKFTSLDFIRIENKEQKEKLLIIFLSLILAIVLTMIFYPGVLYTDSYERWKMAKSFSEFQFSNNNNWLSVAPQIFQAICYKITENIAFYTIIQAFLYFLSSLLLIKYLCEKYYFIQIILFVCCPIFYGFSVFHEMSVGCVIGLNFLILLFFFHNDNIEKRKYIYGIKLFVIFFIIFGYRQNSFTMIPIILLIIWKMYKKYHEKLLVLIQIGTMVMSLLFVSLLPTLLNFETKYDTSSVGFLWESISMLEELKDNSSYNGYFDFLKQPGDTEKAISSNNRENVHGYASVIPYSLSAIGNNANIIKQKYLKLIFENPGIFFKVKWDFIKRTLGIGNYVLADLAFDYNNGNKMSEYGVNDTKRRKSFIESYHNFQERFVLIRKPFRLFYIILIMLILSYKLYKKEEFINTCLIFMLSVSYYTSFIITTQSHEFRYFFPSFWLLFICFCSMLSVWVKNLINFTMYNIKEAKGFL